MKRTTGNEYRSRVRELFLNLREPTNAALRDSIVSGTIPAKEVVNMSQEDLASEVVKAEQAAIDKQNLFAAQGAAATEVRETSPRVLSVAILDFANVFFSGFCFDPAVYIRPRRMRSSVASVVRKRRGTTRCRPDRPMNQ